MLLLLLSRFSHVRLCATPQMAAHQVPLSLGFSRQEFWSGLPFLSPMHACMLTRFSHVRLCATPWTAAHQAPLSTRFSRQEYWSELPSPSLLRHESMPTQKNAKRREACSPILAALFICFFFLPRSLPYVSWVSQEGCLFSLRFSLRSLDLPLFYFRRLLATAILDSFFPF